MGALFLPTGWRLRVFGPSGFVDRPSEHIYVRTIPLSGCMDRCYC